MATGANIVEATLVWTKLSARNLGIKDLAAVLGFTPHHCSLVVNGQTKSIRSRHTIENFLGVAVWSTTAEFEARSEDAAFYGVRIEALEISELVALGKARGLFVKRSTALRRSFVLGVLREHRGVRAAEALA